MAIDFPNSPSNNQTYTEAGVTWIYSTTNNNWTLTTTGNPGVDNSVNHNTELVFLTRTLDRNLLTAAPKLKYVTEALVLSGQAGNMLEFRDGSNNLLNYFNVRGVLNQAGRIIVSGSTPSPAPNAADTGLLWFDSGTSDLRVWTGASWTLAGSGVTLGTQQTISGAKTFSSSVFLSSTAKLSGQGVSKSVTIAATDGSSNQVDGLTVSSTAVTAVLPLELSAVGTTAKTVVATLADAQTIAGAKTLSSDLTMTKDGISDCSIRCSSGTANAGSSDNLVLRPNMANSGRFIKLISNSSTSTGIIIRPKNGDNLGTLQVQGNTEIQGSLNVTGAITSSTGLSVNSVTYASFKSTDGFGSGNINTNADPLGSLTFTQSTSSGNEYIEATNNSSSSVNLYFKREQLEENSNKYVYGLLSVTMGPNAVARFWGYGASVTTVSGSVSSSIIGTSSGSVDKTRTNAPVILTLTLRA